MNELLHWLELGIQAIAVFGGGFTISKYIKKAASTTRNEHIKSILDFASQAVIYAQNYMANGSQQQDIAINNLKERLVGNKLDKFVTDEQLTAYIQKAYAANKANSQLDAVKPTISQPSVEFAKTQQVTEVAK